jgi:hypothetical protein
MEAADAEWIRMYDYDYTSNISVYGDFRLMNTPLVDVHSGSRNDGTYLRVYGGGSFVADGSDVQLHGLEYRTASRGVLDSCGLGSTPLTLAADEVEVLRSDFTGPVTIQDATPTLRDNNLRSGSTITATGDPESHIDAIGNFWGTVDPAAIGSRITDHHDDPSRPYVDFEPFKLHADDDVVGAHVISYEPSGFVQPGVSALQVTFSEAIDPQSFTADDIIVTAPSGDAVGELTFHEGDFEDSSFGQLSNPGSSATASVIADSGNPGDCVRITTHIGPAAYGLAIHDGIAWNPATDGALESVGMELDVKSVSGWGQGQVLRLIVEQDCPFAGQRGPRPSQRRSVICEWRRGRGPVWIYGRVGLWNLCVASLCSRVVLSHSYWASPSVMSHSSPVFGPPPNTLSTGTGEDQYGSMVTNRASPHVQAQ